MTYWKGRFSDTNLKSETFADILTGCSSRCRGEKVSNFKLVSENLTAEAMCGTKFSHVLSLADITIEFAMPSYTVNESVGDAMCQSQVGRHGHVPVPYISIWKACSFRTLKVGSRIGVWM